jgi:hypothetical protein
MDVLIVFGTSVTTSYPLELAFSNDCKPADVVIVTSPEMPTTPESSKIPSWMPASVCAPALDQIAAFSESTDVDIERFVGLSGTPRTETDAVFRSWIVIMPFAFD